MFRSYYRKELFGSILLFLVVCVIAVIGMEFLYQCDNKYSKQPVLTQEGAVYIDSQSLREGTLSFLTDGWEFYPGSHLYPQDFATGRHVERVKYDFDSVPYGSATYTIRLQSGETPVPAQLYFSEVFCVSRVYLDGVLIGGQSEAGGDGRRPSVKDGAYALSLKGKQELIVQTAQDTSNYRGKHYLPALGSAQAIGDMIAFRMLFYGFLSFTSLVIGLFSMVLWRGRRRRRESLFLSFGVLSLSFALRVSNPFIQLAGFSAARPLYVLEEVSAFIGIYCTIWIVALLCGLKKKKIIRAAFIPIALGMCAAGVFIPLFVLPEVPAFIPFYEGMVSYCKLFTAFLLLAFAMYGCVVGNRYSQLVLSAVAVYGVCLIANVWNINCFEPIYTGWQDEYGSFLLVLLLAVLLVRRSHAMMKENIRLTEHLHEEVQGKTKNMLLLADERKTLLAEMMHDLKSPLTSISNYAQLIQRNNLLLDWEAREQIKFIENKCADMGERLLVLQKFTDTNSLSVSMKPVCLNQLLTDFYKRNQSDVEVWGPDFCLELPLKECKIFGDSAKLLRMLENLVYNAAAFTPPEGEIRLSLFYDEKWAHIVVADTGVGIPEDKLVKIFERFYTSRAQEGGQGLGLAIVRDIILEHGGEVRAASREGEGSTFTVRLPMLRLKEEQDEACSILGVLR